MINLRAYDEKEIIQLQLENNPPLNFRLSIDFANSLVLKVVDNNGELRNNGNILSINTRGSLYLCSSINHIFGLKLNGNGQITA